MHVEMLDLLRCPFCGTRLSLVENAALMREGDRIDAGVIGCECCAFPIVAGIPVLLANDTARDAMHQMEAGQHERALWTMLGLDDVRGAAFRALMTSGSGATYRDAIAVISPDAEGTYFIYRFSDPTFRLAESVLQALGQNASLRAGRVLDVCGGSGHLTRTLTDMAPAGGTVLADLFFWKLWLAKTFTAPDSEPVCCDGNHPLPFAGEDAGAEPGSGTFVMVVLSDAFPYIWHKRLLAGEMMRVAGAGGAVVMPHLHSSLGWNYSAGMTLTPASYRDLLRPLSPRLFSDAALTSQFLDGGALDLGGDLTIAALGDEPSFTMIASRAAGIFRRYELPPPLSVHGELRVNPLYRVEPTAAGTTLTLTFPTPEYADEFAACRRYLPDVVDVAADLSGAIDAAAIGADYPELRARRVIIDAPLRYC